MDQKLLKSMLADWQQIVDLMAHIAHVPAGLIMEIRGEELAVLVASDTQGNPYHIGETCKWGDSGLYCEHVVKSQHMLLVPNALQSARWRHNPDIKLGMVAYLGFPIRLPDGTPFGTICLLDSQENHFSSDIIALMKKMRTLIEGNLKIRLLMRQNARHAAQITKKNSTLKNLNRILAENEKKLRFITENTVDSIWVYNVRQNTFTHANPSVPPLCAGDRAGGHKPTLQDVVMPEFLEATLQRMREHTRLLRKNPATPIVSRCELRRKCADGSAIWIEYNTKYMINAKGEVEIVGVSRNIEERKRREQEINFLSTHDYLTKTLNRSCLFTQGAVEIANAARDGLPVAMIFFDLDRFKHVNDLYGHAAGDAVLQKTTDAISGHLKPSDMFVRCGGEEFIVLLPGADIAAACETAKNMREAVEATIMPNGISMTISIGVSQRLPDEDLYAWIDRTDKTMYRAKKAGGNCLFPCAGNAGDGRHSACEACRE